MGFPQEEKDKEREQGAPDADETLEGEQDPKKSDEEEADEQSDDSFPASDPPAW